METNQNPTTNPSEGNQLDVSQPRNSSFSNFSHENTLYKQWNPELGCKVGLGVQNEAGQRLTEFSQDTLVTANTRFQQYNTQVYTWTSLDGQHQNQIDGFLWPKDEEALYSQQKQDLKVTLMQIMNSLLENSGLNWRN